MRKKPSISCKDEKHVFQQVCYGYHKCHKYILNKKGPHIGVLW